jgi:hypothetical protein
MERTSHDDGCLMYPQDAVKLLLRYQEDEKKACDGDGGSDAEAPFSNVFFEFANTKRVGYKADGQEFVLVFDQDENACGHVSTSRAPSVEQAPSIVADRHLCPTIACRATAYWRHHMGFSLRSTKSSAELTAWIGKEVSSRKHH